MTRNIAKSRGFSYSSLAPNLDWGVSIADLRPEDVSNPEIRQDLYELWIQEGVIVFRGIADPEIQLALSNIFGPLRPHPSPENRTGSAGELTNVRYTVEDGWVSEVDGQMRGNWLPWHSDLIYVDKINHGGILRPLKLPEHLGQTGFIDKISAYTNLPDALKTRIEDLHVVYKYDMDVGQMRFGRTHEVRVVKFSKQAQAVQDSTVNFPKVLHPMVFTQQQTGRKVLNVSPWFATGIFEMPDEEGDELLHEVMQHVVSQTPYHHEWTMSDMVLWDNWRMLHSAAGSPADEERHMQRTTIGGDYGLGRIDPSFTGAQEGLRYIQV